MKNIAKIFLIAGVSVLLFASCGNNRDAEKRIAELESRLAELENGSTATPQVAPSTQPEEKPEGPLPSFEFSALEHDFGSITEGDVVEHTFTFTNNGEAPLIIQNAVGSCGCTVPTYTKEPIAVGETGEIVVKFDSKGKPNLQNKTVTITANTWPKKSLLRIKAMVTPATAVQ